MYKDGNKLGTKKKIFVQNKYAIMIAMRMLEIETNIEGSILNIDDILNEKLKG